MGMLSRLMANIGVPIRTKRKLIMTATSWILLYGSEIWGDALEVESKRKILTVALRVASAYSTVSGDAVLVIVGGILIDLLAFERRKSLKMKRENLAVSRSDLRSQTLRRWQNRWREEISGRWTGKFFRLWRYEYEDILRKLTIF